METITLHRDENRDLRFEGKQIASQCGRNDGSTRWTNRTLYRAKSGQLIFHEEHMTQWQGESDRNHVFVYTDLDGLLFDLDGFPDWLYALLHEAGFDDELVEDLERLDHHL